jgi:thiol-disulfide isomerase/thioredoxin
VDQWLTPPPMVDGKFVLVEFWTTWAEPCRKAVSHLNELQAKFKDQLVVIGLSNENEEDIRKMTSPHMDYSVGTDTQARTWNMIGVEGIPHVILIDPQNTVRFEGQPDYLTEKGLTNLIARYSN